MVENSRGYAQTFYLLVIFFISGEILAMLYNDHHSRMELDFRVNSTVATSFMISTFHDFYNENCKDYK